MEITAFSNKFVIAPCSGVGQTVGTISRQAAYMVVDELIPSQTLLLCLPAYVANVEEDVRMVRENPDRIIVIDGCSRMCMTKILRERGYEPAKTIVVSEVVREMKLKIDKTKNRAMLSDVENRIVSEVARRVAEAIRKLKESELSR